MGTYCTYTSLSPLMKGTNLDTATIDTINECIEMAEDEIDKYLSKRYDISQFRLADSIGAVSPTVKTICKNLSLGYAWDALSRGGKESGVRADRYMDRAMQNLKDIADGKANVLDVDYGVIADVSGGSYEVYTNTDEYSSTFNEDNPLNWAVDPDKLAAIATERE